MGKHTNNECHSTLPLHYRRPGHHRIRSAHSRGLASSHDPFRQDFLCLIAALVTIGYAAPTPEASLLRTTPFAKTSSAQAPGSLVPEIQLYSHEDEVEATTTGALTFKTPVVEGVTPEEWKIHGEGPMFNKAECGDCDHGCICMGESECKCKIKKQ